MKHGAMNRTLAGTEDSGDRVWRDPVLWLACGIGILVIADVAGIAPSLPLLASALDIPLSRVGLVLSSFMLPGLVIAPLAGLLADRHGRLAVLLPGLVALGVLGASCSLAGSSKILFVLRFCAGCGAGAVSVMSLTLLGSRFKGRRLAGATAIFGFVQTGATAVMPWIGGSLAQISWRAPFLLSLVALPLVLAAWRLERGRTAERTGPPPGFMAMFKVVDRKLGMILAVEFINFALLTGSLLTYVPVLLKTRFAAEPRDIGLIVAFAATVSALAALSTKRLARILGPRGVVVAGFALYVPAYLIAPQSGTLAVFLTAAAFLGAGRGLNLPSLIRLLNEQAPEGRRALCNGAYLFVLRAGQTAGPLVAGLVYALAGLDGVFHFDAVVSILAVGLALLLPVRKN